VVEKHFAESLRDPSSPFDTLDIRLLWGARLELSGDGTVLAAAIGGDVRLWDGRTGWSLSKLPISYFPVSKLALTGDGKVLAVAIEGTVRLWNVETVHPVGPVLDLGSSVQDLVVRKDGRVVAAGDRIVRVWHVALDGPSSRPPNDPVPGDPKVLLREWQKRLALTFNEKSGQIEPILTGEGALRTGP
jgi:WD40 repeat protein